MNQIVYVVANVNDETIPGVYNEYEDALAAIKDINSPDVSITPVLVDAEADADRIMCYDEDDVEEATSDEIDLAINPYNEDEDEAYEDEDDEDDEDEDENEDEDEDPIESMTYEMDGKTVVSKEDALTLLKIVYEIVANDEDIALEDKPNMATKFFLDFCKEKGIWGVDMRD